ncbi:alpha/beta fold hydrolase [Rhodococcus opacus]|uniref:Hydrolase n=1 Tax=Rhodococcus opacus TaxID=37919 RepID=A0A076F5E9_RHOOP|nr:alpha/beta hydrolase [Rhodococcus opacus]AII10894.1 hydrolase [Rhodococcus opacus]
MHSNTETIVLRGSGVDLVADRWTSSRTAKADQTVLLLHGGGQTRHAWRSTCDRLARTGWTAIAMDTRGHGESDWASDGQYDMDDYVADLRAVVQTLEVRPVIVGASMGGLTALIAQGEDPSLAAGLVLVDVVPRMDPRGADEVTSFMRDGINGFDSVDQAVAAVAAYNPHRRTKPRPGGILKNLRERGGRWYWHWDPRVLDGHGGESADSPATNKAARNEERALAAARTITVPLLVVRGQQSNVVSPDGVQELLDLIPGARSIEIRGAAHMVAGDDNDVFSIGLSNFLENHIPSES